VAGIGAERVDFVTVPTRDRERAVRFYRDTLRLEPNAHAHESFPEFELGNVTIAIGDAEAVGIEFAPLPFAAIALRVPDVAAARTELEEAGVEFRGETIDSGVCHMAFFSDPDGNGLMLHRRYAPFADGRQP
jgi:catechol 2,3-dioxygenase-like lactoylglutathione lyase family enzyme